MNKFAIASVCLVPAVFVNCGARVDWGSLGGLEGIADIIGGKSQGLGGRSTSSTGATGGSQLVGGTSPIDSGSQSTGGARPNGGAGGSNSTAAGGSREPTQPSTGGTVASGEGGDSSGVGGSPNGIGGAGNAAGSQTVEPLLGGFTVTMKPAVPETELAVAMPAYTTMRGIVYSREYPPAISWGPELEDSGCQVLTKQSTSCVPACSGTEVCISDNTCVAYPNSVSLGTVTVDGMGTRFTLIQINNNYQPPGSAQLSYPPTAEGGDITITAGGSPDGIESFALHGTGIAPLELTTTQFDLQDAQPLALAWGAPGPTSQSVVQIHLDISHHGGGISKVECVVPDNGHFDIPAPIISKLLTLGKAGYPSIVLTRVSTSQTSVAGGRIQLSVTSPVERQVKVPGVVSCTENSQCEAPQTCSAGMICQ